MEDKSVSLDGFEITISKTETNLFIEAEETITSKLFTRTISDKPNLEV